MTKQAENLSEQRKRLLEEKTLLQDALVEIDRALNSLQIEQFNLLELLNKSNGKSLSENENKNNELLSNTSDQDEELDLDVPSHSVLNIEEEDEDDDEDENEEN
ncbi:hypothetical protein HCN44_005681 [Aphidius gifuensis]|uniref:Uncharacterized protein n=1 Tax=Aphidius gifuensis TaxID=684658 RepID=A0A835CU28_APHGI|nr:putative mediator of RNA polymerase II transcription subunit 12 isoform X1 [Aphidius gifuensis]KAF7992900.1 hypothetical protein HCN44_005681 [Aphidius gifuensis]